MMDKIKNFRIIFLLLGLSIIFSVERYFQQYSGRLAVNMLGLFLVSLTFISSLYQYKKARENNFVNEAQSWAYNAIWVASVLAGIFLYFIYTTVMGDSGAVETPLQKVLLASWLSLILLGLFSGIGSEFGLKATGLGDLAEPFRMKLSIQTWLGIGLLLGSLICINFIANKIDKAWDLSYLKTSKPGESTLKIVDSLDGEVVIGAFFEKDSEVEPFVREYLEQVASRNSLIKLNFYSKDFYPSKAEEFRVSRDGQVILMKDKKRQRIDVGEEISFASKKLKKFDQLFQKELLAVTSAKKNIYVTSGHGEMSWKGKRTSTRSLRNFEKVLRSLNYNVRTLGADQGGFSEVPKDAELIAVPGASKPFTKQEIDVLNNYIKSGGNLLVYFDVEFSGEERGVEGLEGQNNLQKFLEKFGIAFKKSILANDRQFVSNTRKSIDHFFLFTNNFSSHASMSSLNKNDDRMGVLTFQSGYLEVSKNLAGDWKVLPTIQSLNSTFADENRNTKFDQGEVRKNYTIAMAAESGDSKIIAFSDSTMISDPVILNPGNSSALVDSVRWLAGETKIIGNVVSEEDIKIRHSKSRDLVVFHGSIYLVPLLVLVFGFFVNRSREEMEI